MTTESETPAPEPSADEPGADAPGADAPGADEPGADAPGVDAPGSDEPGVDVTPAALALIAELVEEHGPLMFHQSGGCCDGSAPMCYPRGELRLGARDVRLGTVGEQPFYIGGDQYERWKHTRLTLDVVAGRGAGFSLEAPRGVRFLIRSDLCEPA